ncbi:hypothetical protein BJY00DRAFT_278291 [Aspergillus carlsbadensis]|nr:hypothetical protein BJY00DRAFT_278291 [Aspergillus carlsbadensis]
MPRGREESQTPIKLIQIPPKADRQCHYCGRQRKPDTRCTQHAVNIMLLEFHLEGARNTREAIGENWHIMGSNPDCHGYPYEANHRTTLVLCHLCSRCYNDFYGAIEPKVKKPKSKATTPSGNKGVKGHKVSNRTPLHNKRYCQSLLPRLQGQEEPGSLVGGC